MHLKSLTLKGFKSFADRSVLSFEPGITAIVGPNGSGKSNVSDSVLWVLGERNAKNLRGQAMEDVVFAGSSARKPVGIAEVDLVLDNADGKLPVEYSEVSLTRRMYRSGESEYLINGTLSRRMDVLDVLHDTGLGTGTHSIISQGNLDSLLQSKPEDRRTLIEEAAGVLKHKQRKQKSERKLEAMDAHLTRVKDVAAEVERQLKPLERKAKRAQAYQGLAAELDGLTLALAVDDLRALQKKWEASGAGEQRLLEEIERHRALIGSVEERMQQLQEQVQAGSVNAGGLAASFRRVESVVERFESTILLLREKRRAAAAYEAEILLALDANAAKMGQAQANRQQAEAQLGEVVAGREEAEGSVARLQDEYDELSQQRSRLDQSLDELRAAERRLTRELETQRLALAENQELLSSNRAQEQLIASHGKELEIQLGHAKGDFEASSSKAAALEAELEALKAKEAAVRESVAHAFAARERAREATDGLRDEVSLLISEIKASEEFERSRESATPALSWLSKNQGDFEGEVTPLSHIVSAPADMEPLVEWLLGSDLDAVFVDDLASAEAISAALVYLDTQGEVSLLPKSDMRKAGQPARPQAPAAALTDLIDYPPAYAQAVEALLGDVFVCGSIAEAAAAYEAGGDGCRFATKEGFMIWGNGKISVGMGKFDEEGLLARRRRLEKARERLAVKQGELEEAVGTAAEAEEAMRAAQGESLQLSEQLANLKGVCSAAQEERKRSEEKAQSLRREFEDLERQRALTQAALAEAQPAERDLSSSIGKTDEALKATKQQIDEAQERVAPLREQLQACSDKLAAARLAQATNSEKESYARRMLDTSEQEIAALGRDSASARLNLARKRAAKQRVEPLIAQFEALIEKARGWAAELEEATSKAQSSSSGLHKAINEARGESRRLQDALDQLSEKLAGERVEKGRLEVQVEAAIATIVEDCKTPLETALAMGELEDRGEVEDEAFKLKRRIANMGTINPDAAVEYEELKTRFDYMSSQLEDMMGARRALAKIVRVIDARMKDDFVRTFEQVNKNFQEIFSVLFPGGSAELSLADPEDPENTGVEVTAQPRGKRIAKMMLMSGGEKSLTALALLFAVYRIRSAPFYILDEVEAALDDTNLRRLCAYFDSLRNTTQLILITHQRRTMELADVLYGISMQADGVTRVVSQKLERALQHAEG